MVIDDPRRSVGVAPFLAERDLESQPIDQCTQPKGLLAGVDLAGTDLGGCISKESGQD
jgi:hypothetical protein